MLDSKIILFDDNKHCFFESGTLVLPIYEECVEKMVVFFVCGGLDEDNNVPEWTNEYYPYILQLSITLHLYIHKRGIGVVSLDLNKDFVSVQK